MLQQLIKKCTVWRGKYNYSFTLPLGRLRQEDQKFKSSSDYSELRPSKTSVRPWNKISQVLWGTPLEGSLVYIKNTLKLSVEHLYPASTWEAEAEVKMRTTVAT